MRTILLSSVILMNIGALMLKEDGRNIFNICFRVECRKNGLEILKEVEDKARKRNVTGFLLDSNWEDVLFGCFETDNKTFEYLTSWIVSSAGPYAKLVIRTVKHYDCRIYKVFDTCNATRTREHLDLLILNLRAANVPLDDPNARYTGRRTQLNPLTLPW